jgi:hypothetical protein
MYLIPVSNAALKEKQDNFKEVTNILKMKKKHRITVTTIHFVKWTWP